MFDRTINGLAAISASEQKVPEKHDSVSVQGSMVLMLSARGGDIDQPRL